MTNGPSLVTYHLSLHSSPEGTAEGGVMSVVRRGGETEERTVVSGEGEHMMVIVKNAHLSLHCLFPCGVLVNK